MSFLSFLNPNSQKNIDSKIYFYLSELKDEDLSSVKSIQKTISETKNHSNKKRLQIQLRNRLKNIYDDFQFKNLEETIDRCW